MKNQNEMMLCSFCLLLVVITLFLSVTHNRKVSKVGRQLTSGPVNTVLILLIIVLTITEDMQVGFMLTLIYLILLVRFNRQENFESGPSPLNCDTYGDSKKRNGSSFYPLHAN